MKIIIRCPVCGSKNIQARQDGISWCRKCGWKGPTEETKHEKEEA